MNAATYDERHGVPSASAMERLVNCPPSHKLAQLLPPEREEEVGKDAQRGTRIHLALSGDLPEAELNAADAETFDMCQRQAKALAVEWGLPEDFVAVRERRLGLTVLGRVIEAHRKNRTATFVFTGQADLILIEGQRALVIDYKTGRGDYAEAVDNAQLASLAALVSLWQPVQAVRVAIVQPWVGPPTVADYDADALRKSWDWLHASLHAADMATPAERRAGPWCKWCRVGKAGQCDVANGAALEVVEVIEPESLATLPDDTQREAMFARAIEMPAEKLAAAMNGLPMVERFVAAIKGAARQRAGEDAEFQRFWTLREKKGRRSISDVRKVFERCASQGVTAEAFTALCSIGLGDVKDLLRGATGAKGKALDSLADAALEGAVEIGKPSYELVPVEGGGGVSSVIPHVATLPPVLDPCCGSRMWWFDKENPLALYGDRRRETLAVTDRSHGKMEGQRILRIDPDVVIDFRDLPFPDGSFHLVAFDPPHLVRAGKQSWLAAKYGKLGQDWRDDLRAGFLECFRVLRPHGVLVFKWNETQVKVREVLELAPVVPLFGNTSGRKTGTHWIVFMKPQEGGAA